MLIDSGATNNVIDENYIGKTVKIMCCPLNREKTELLLF